MGSKNRLHDFIKQQLDRRPFFRFPQIYADIIHRLNEKRVGQQN